MKLKKDKSFTSAPLSGKYGSEVACFIEKFGGVSRTDCLVEDNRQFINAVMLKNRQLKRVVYLEKMNEIKNICHFLAEINHGLQRGGLFICCLETNFLRRKRIFRKYNFITGKVIYFFDYLLTRLTPAIFPTRWISQLLVRSHDRAISYYEMVGRLSYCGFEIESDEVIEGKHYMAARKVASSPPVLKENYGLLLGLNRVGQHGGPIRVYKFRTMVSFSEYVQEHIYRKNNLRKGGKFRNDRRVTLLGRIFRRFWIDEIPMLLNVLKGDVKLVGVRPLSPQYLALYSPEVVARRQEVKPGLIPPYYVDLPSTLEEIQASELKYIERWEKNPLLTDVRYFFLVLWNIIWHGARGK